MHIRFWSYKTLNLWISYQTTQAWPLVSLEQGHSDPRLGVKLGLDGSVCPVPPFLYWVDLYAVVNCISLDVLYWDVRQQMWPLGGFQIPIYPGEEPHEGGTKGVLWSGTTFSEYNSYNFGQCCFRPVYHPGGHMPPAHLETSNSH